MHSIKGVRVLPAGRSSSYESEANRNDRAIGRKNPRSEGSTGGIALFGWGKN
jgi:hypothetical protein